MKKGCLNFTTRIPHFHAFARACILTFNRDVGACVRALDSPRMNLNFPFQERLEDADKVRWAMLNRMERGDSFRKKIRWSWYNV